MQRPEYCIFPIAKNVYVNSWARVVIGEKRYSNIYHAARNLAIYRLILNRNIIIHKSYDLCLVDVKYQT